MTSEPQSTPPAEQPGDPDALVERARQALMDGDPVHALDLLISAAEGWNHRGDEEQEARCWRMAASLARTQGRFDDARALAEHAVAAAPSGTRAAALAHAEAAAVALAHTDKAALAHTQAALANLATEDPESDLAELYRVHTTALLAAGRVDEAVDAVERGAEVWRKLGRHDAALRTLLDGVALFQGQGRRSQAEHLASEANLVAEDLDHHAAHSELALLAAGRAIEDGDLPGARLLAARAREEAMASRTPTVYVIAVIAFSRLAEADKDYLAAYAALADGWTVLSEMAGPESARDAFEPLMSEARTRWGAQGYVQAKGAYEERQNQAGDGH
jgi:tetratricopeptide (TPR) repeat protein